MKKKEINVLVLDDDESVRKVLTDAINRFGYKPTVLGKPEEAINVAKIKTVEFAIIDCMLPKKNGIQVAAELRQGQFGQRPILLISGVFKDKAFSSDSIKKTGAIGFLTKPFDLKELKQIIDKEVSHLFEESSIPLHSLVSKQYTSARERRKAIERIEEISGFDLPFVIGVLMDSKSSGHINIYNNAGEIFGIALSEGKISKVDTSETTATLGLLLIQHGFISSKELDELGAGSKKGDLLSNLVSSNLVSPHASPIIKTEQTLIDLKRLFGPQKVQFNFVPDNDVDEGAGVDLEKLTPILHEAIQTTVSEEYLLEFYKGWKEYPIQLGPQFSNSHPAFQLPLLKGFENFPKMLSQGITINEISESSGKSSFDVLRAIHFLAIRNIIQFSDVKKIKSLVGQVDHLKNMIKILKDKNPIEIFRYFGASDSPKHHEVDRIYKDYAKTNHPDKLPPTTSKEIQQIFNQMFSILSDAHDILTNETKRSKFMVDMQTQDAERQIRAESLAEEALSFLQRGKYKEALEELLEAYKLYEGKNIKVYLAWAKLRNKSGHLTVGLAKEIETLLESIPLQERREAKYQYVQGIFQKAQGDLKGAKQSLERAMQFDPNFLEARREMSAIPDGKTKGGKTDLLNTDLGEIIGNFFKKNAK